MSYFNYQSKRIYYSVTGEGKPAVLLHGDTASSAMFELLKPLYEARFQVILIDFLGNGKSDRVERFPADLWPEEGRQVIALLEHLGGGKVSLIGTSGGAWAAINAALQRPDLVECVVADSFDGRTLAGDFAENLLKERETAKQDEHAVEFYQWCQGDDWETVVDANTAALVQCAREKCPLFVKPIYQLQVPLLLMGTLGDEMTRPDFPAEYEAISRETGAAIHIFPTGFHPAIMSNGEEALEVIDGFLHTSVPCSFMNEETQNRLAESLTAETTSLIPYLPYLLQDFWSLSCEPEKMIDMLHAHSDFGPDSRLLDLACGKGAAAVCLAKEFGCRARGIDLIPEFIDEAKEKAKEYGVGGLCDFAAGDVNEAVDVERDYDLTIWGGAGDLLGSYPKTIEGIAGTVRQGGYILFDDGYIQDENQKLRFHHDFLTKAQWEQVFKDNHLVVLACREPEEDAEPEDYAEDLGNIRRRAEELIAQFPGRKELFLGYVRSQQAEYEDMQDGFADVTWLLQKEEE